MSILALGLSHRTAPVSLLDRAALTGPSPAELLRAALRESSVLEAAVLATCNRIEVYAEVDRFHGAVAELSALLAEHTGVPLEELTEHLYVHYEDRAVHHVFSVAAGLDSMVVGEGQILGQLREALALAQGQHTAGRALNELIQQALRVGKRAHSETGIDRAGQSLVTVGLAEVEKLTGPLAERRVLVVGAGSMSALAATTLARSGVRRLTIANRTAAKAERLATDLGAASFDYHRLAEAIAAAEVVVSCTGAAGHVITPDLLAGREDELVLLDLAMPRDVDPAVRELPGVRVIDLERLAEAAETAGTDVARARELVSEEVGVYRAARSAAVTTPAVVALRAMATEVVRGELARLHGRLPDLDDKARAEVAQAIHRVVEKLLHAPTVRIKQLAGEPGGASYAEALRELFDLDVSTVAAVSQAGAPRPAGDRQPADETAMVADLDRARDLNDPAGAPR